MEQQHDEMFMMVAQRCGGIGPLLDAFFSFLYRKTDFFHVMQEGENMGFAPGVAEKLVLGHFHKYEAMAVKKRGTGAPSAKGKGRGKDGGVPHVGTVRTSSGSNGGSGNSTASKSSSKAACSTAATSQITPVPTPAPAAEGARVISASEIDAKAGASHIKSSLALESTYNGGETEKYVWEQTIADVTIAVPLPAGTRSRDILCVIGRRHLKLQLKGGDVPVLDDDYPCDDRNNQCIWEQVKTEQSFWNFADGKCTIYLEKERESWWKSALHGHVEIDTTKVDSVKRVEDYDGETQGAIRKIMFDQDQKRKGLPTSDELKNMDMIKQVREGLGLHSLVRGAHLAAHGGRCAPA
mmetsp:Transcript_25354/g.65502  ORF Transcript_25354/g.65502 Transcript_25354/m.65502 type:complete len:352 (-) Transcript_25354:364-1419(-)